MKASLERLTPEPGESFVVRQFDYSYFPARRHYHTEYEIMLVTESTGKRFVGDNIAAFAPGDLVLLGPGIPHSYCNDEVYYQHGSFLRAKCILIHFSEGSLGADLLNLPEAMPIRRLLQRAGQGITITGQTRQQVTGKIQEIVTQKGLLRWQTLLKILVQLAESAEWYPISRTVQTTFNRKETVRLSGVFHWLSENYTSPVRLADAAQVAGMNENAFSRFFAQRTRKTFSGYVQEMRLQKAARLLIEDKISVTEICYECGYNNISNFNRQFLNYYQMSPVAYRKAFLQAERDTG